MYVFFSQSSSTKYNVASSERKWPFWTVIFEKISNQYWLTYFLVTNSALSPTPERSDENDNPDIDDYVDHHHHQDEDGHLDKVEGDKVATTNNDHEGAGREGWQQLAEIWVLHIWFTMLPGPMQFPVGIFSIEWPGHYDTMITGMFMVKFMINVSSMCDKGLLARGQSNRLCTQFLNHGAPHIQD